MTSYRPIIGNGVLISLQDLLTERGANFLVDLLNSAEKREIDLLFAPPRGISLVLLPDLHKFHWDCQVVGLPVQGEEPEYLVLQPSLCAQLIQSKQVDLATSDCGYKSMRNALTGAPGQFFKAPPSDAGKNRLFPVAISNISGIQRVEEESLTTWQHWGFVSNKGLFWHRVRIDDLFVIAKDFKAWIVREMEKNPSTSYWLGRQGSETGDDLNDDFKSPQLLRMCEAAMKLWGNEKVIPEDPSTHPNNRTVIDWLMQSGAGFTKTSAESAAALIKPSFGLKAGAPEIKTCTSRKRKAPKNV